MLLNLPSPLMQWVLDHKGSVSPSRFVQLLVEQEYNKCSNKGAENGRDCTICSDGKGTNEVSGS